MTLCVTSAQVSHQIFSSALHQNLHSTPSLFHASPPFADRLFSLNFPPHLRRRYGPGTSNVATQPSSVIVQCTPIPSYMGRAAITIPPAIM
ncbi:hypothetical protein HBI28_183010 [Parastagonospora nodorum]|nr:hypothetical protein HBH72_058270 [Parastagonospora nodorum]KAH5468676.1 hypothetical protein HBI28_183010 [Parastagonospora nodorum]